jgi:hypothetical protein
MDRTCKFLRYHCVSEARNIRYIFFGAYIIIQNIVNR